MKRAEPAGEQPTPSPRSVIPQLAETAPTATESLPDFDITAPSEQETTSDADEVKVAQLGTSSVHDIRMTIATCVGGVGLLLLCLSPFFSWVNFGAGGATGLSGDGRIVLGVSIVAIAAYITAMIRRKWVVPISLAAQAWGTVAVFWMGALIWKVSSILESPEIKDNPFAALFATQIGPGAGLYVGLIGGIAAASP